jgi:hypothetical protein
VQFVLAGIIVFVVVAFFAGPALASRLSGARLAAVPVVAAIDSYDKALLKYDLKGTIKLDISASKLADKWKSTEVKCDDVTVVATGALGVVTMTKAASAPGDPASCVYAMKVPSDVSLSVYAAIGSPKSIEITGFHKIAADKWDTTAIKSDPVKEGFLKIDGIKGESAAIKLKAGESATLPLYIKLSS